RKEGWAWEKGKKKTGAEANGLQEHATPVLDGPSSEEAVPTVRQRAHQARSADDHRPRRAHPRLRSVHRGEPALGDLQGAAEGHSLHPGSGDQPGAPGSTCKASPTLARS